MKRKSITKLCFCLYFCLQGVWVMSQNGLGDSGGTVFNRIAPKLVQQNGADVEAIARNLRQGIDHTYSEYVELFHWFELQGDFSAKRRILYEWRERQRGGLAWTDIEYHWQTLLKVLFGYGYYPEMVAVWYLLFVMAGKTVLVFSSQGARYTIGVLYTIDKLLPLIEMHPHHRAIIIEKRWVRILFTLYRLVGFVLLLFLMAGFYIVMNLPV